MGYITFIWTDMQQLHNNPEYIYMQQSHKNAGDICNNLITTRETTQEIYATHNNFITIQDICNDPLTRRSHLRYPQCCIMSYLVVYQCGCNTIWWTYVYIKVLFMNVMSRRIEAYWHSVMMGVLASSTQCTSSLRALSTENNHHTVTINGINKARMFFSCNLVAMFIYINVMATPSNYYHWHVIYYSSLCIQTIRRTQSNVFFFLLSHYQQINNNKICICHCFRVVWVYTSTSLQI